MHFLFTSWPDYGVPKKAVAMLDFLQKVRQGQANMLRELGDKWAGHPRGPPIVVHCSAGIGRTGTYHRVILTIALTSKDSATDEEQVDSKFGSHSAQTPNN